MADYLIILLATGVFGVQHSGFASNRIKHRIIDRWGKRAYSRIFTGTSIVVFLIAFLTIEIHSWFAMFLSPITIDWPFFIVGVIMIAGGSLIALRASAVISVSTVADMRTDREPELITNGIYAKIRHPLYLATVLVFLALIPLYLEPHIAVFGIAMSIYTVLGAYFEEKKLVGIYGSAYLEYQRQAGFLTPKICSKKNSGHHHN